MKNNSSNSNHEKNEPENLKLLQVPTTPSTAPPSPTRAAIDDLFKELPITDETACGFWCFRGPILQRFANKKAYVFLYGVLGCIFSASFAYFNGTITTIEKRFKIPSKTTGTYHISPYCISNIKKRYCDRECVKYLISESLVNVRFFKYVKSLNSSYVYLSIFHISVKFLKLTVRVSLNERINKLKINY